MTADPAFGAGSPPRSIGRMRRQRCDDHAVKPINPTALIEAMSHHAKAASGSSRANAPARI